MAYYTLMPNQRQTVQLTKNFSLKAQLIHKKLKITLMDFNEFNLYSYSYSSQDIGGQITIPMTLQDIFISLSSPNCSEIFNGLKGNSTYNYGDVIYDSKYYKCFQIDKEGRLTVFLIMLDKRTEKEKIYQSNLVLNFERMITEVQKVQLMMNYRIRKLTQESKMQVQKQKNKNRKLEQKIDKLQNKYEESMEKVRQLEKKLNAKEQSEERQLKFNNQPKVEHKQNISWDLYVYPGKTTHSAQIFGKQFRCSIGKNGASAFHKQGDGKTPVGTFPLRQIWYRADKITKQIYDILTQTGLPVRTINTFDGWCDQSSSPYYNKHVDLRTFDTSISHEKLWRNDDLYDCFIVVGYNDAPVVPGRGSAIFIHVASLNYGGTAGCVAFAKPDLWEVIKYIKAYSKITVYDQKSVHKPSNLKQWNISKQAKQLINTLIRRVTVSGSVSTNERCRRCKNFCICFTIDIIYQLVIY